MPPKVCSFCRAVRPWESASRHADAIAGSVTSPLVLASVPSKCQYSCPHGGFIARLSLAIFGNVAKRVVVNFELEPAMFLIASLRLVFLLISSSFTLSAEAEEGPVCAQIGASISSSSDVFYPGTNLLPSCTGTIS